jgi:hypothetical protein
MVDYQQHPGQTSKYQPVNLTGQMSGYQPNQLPGQLVSYHSCPERQAVQIIPPGQMICTCPRHAEEEFSHHGQVQYEGDMEQNLPEQPSYGQHPPGQPSYGQPPPGQVMPMDYPPAQYSTVECPRFVLENILLVSVHVT